MTRPGLGGDAGAVDVAVGALIIGVLAAGLLRVAGSITAWLLALTPPTAGLDAGALVLFDPSDPARVLDCPALPTIAYWSVAGILLTTIGAGAWAARGLLDTHRPVRVDPHRAPGTATRAEASRVASARALLARGRHLRPSLDRPAVTDVGYLLGRARGVRVWASVEDSILLLGPPRSGKGAHIVINTILDAPGAVVTTSTRPDNLTATLTARTAAGGPVAVFDPQHLADGLPAGLRWSPIRGCSNPLTAMIRAHGLAAGTGIANGSVENGGFWEAKTRVVLQALLHAAALDDRTPAELFLWTLDPAAAGDAVAILTTHPKAATGWGESLRAVVEADPRTRDSIWQGVSLTLSALADPRVLDTVSPTPAEQFDPEAFLRASGTLYLLATGAGAGASAALVAALIEDVVEAARTIAARSPGARLDPPLLLALDEIGNLVPLPSLPTLMAEGGGTGITTLPVLQSLAQARHRWGAHAAAAIWDAAIVKIILGGESDAGDLRDLSLLIGDRDETTDSHTTGEHGSHTVQRSSRRVPVMPPEAVRTLPRGTALLLLRAAPPIILRMRAWTRRRDRTALLEGRRRLEERLIRP